MLFQFVLVLDRNWVPKSKLLNVGKINIVKFRIHSGLNILNKEIKEPEAI